MASEADDVAAQLRAEFPRALQEGQLVGYFQPEVELSTGQLVAAELLARWEHPELGTLPPSSFLSLVEQLGLMTEFSLEMLRQALVQHRAWAAAGWLVPVSVNIGPGCVADPDFPAAVSRLLGEEQVPGQMIALEVSEETGTSAISARFFAQLAETGIQFSLDDFGTGFASLESLGGWPINELKLDSSIVRPIISSTQLPQDRRHHDRPRAPARRQGSRRRGRVRGHRFRAGGSRVRHRPGVLPRAPDVGRGLHRVDSRPGQARAAHGSVRLPATESPGPPCASRRSGRRARRPRGRRDSDGRCSRSAAARWRPRYWCS